MNLREHPKTEEELNASSRDECIVYAEETAELIITLLAKEHPKPGVTALLQAAAYYAHKAEIRPTECIAVLISHYNDYTVAMAQAAGRDRADLVSMAAIEMKPDIDI
ncbi:MAG: hypothetical protein FVQ79_00195 [Planctomycetes bacterium]|nr:hypothetical protein [Planctomycetota bacterium]